MTSELPPQDDGSLSAIIAAYLDAVDAGETPDREELMARHPGHAAALSEFFAVHEQLQALARPFQPGHSPVAAETQDPPAERTLEDAGEGQVRTFGDYELQGEIARGGMGVVYRARQISLNRPVAVKMIKAGQFADEREVRRFRDEAEAAARLDHSNIVPIYEVGEFEGQHYFSMKLIEGSNLNNALSGFRDNPRAIARLMIDVARAVHHAHQRGILHRDLKPSNILIDAEGAPHVTDFGLAKRLEQDGKLTHSGAIVGTPEYMAPEQARGEKGLTTAADTYGLGAVLYFLLTGRPPFQGDYNWETIKKVVEQDPPRPRSMNRRVDRDLETICLHCLRKDPGRRYGSAEAFADDL